MTTDDRYDLLEEPFQKGHAQAQINALARGYSSFMTMAMYASIGTCRFLMARIVAPALTAASASPKYDAAPVTPCSDIIIAMSNTSSFSEDGLRPAVVEGKLEFTNVSFRYPTRPEISVLKRFHLTIEAGETVAFCGPSGGGKSTIISLVGRFYDPVRGGVFLDGNNFQDINVQWLRGQIGLVGQEPVLFSGSIAENIAHGLSSEATAEEIEAAAKMANAHDFISQFPEGYETQVGTRGEQLSGGQKQRIAIARAILKNPSILLLDEATSALDSESERLVQDALDKVVALKRRTTIIVAHRLSTIRKADRICVVRGGRVAESGSHNELLARKGLYANLVNSATA